MPATRSATGRPTGPTTAAATTPAADRDHGTRPAQSWRLAEGDAITGELTAVRRLGGGLAYEAWLAFDEVTYSPVVVKLLRPDQVDDGSSRRGLRREVAALAAVNHPVVVRGLRHDLDGPRPHVVLEHIDGPRLSSLVRRYGPLQEQQYLPLAIDVAASLHYLRHIGWTHLDIKPSNIIMGAPARLIDLSVARPEEDARGLRHLIGTDAYMSPEQCDPGRGGAVATPATSGASARPSSRRSRGSAPSTTRDPGPTRWTSASRRWPSDARAPCPTGCRAEVVKVIRASLAARPRDRPLAARGRRRPRARAGPPARAGCG